MHALYARQLGLAGATNLVAQGKNCNASRLSAPVCRLISALKPVLSSLSDSHECI